MRLQMDFLCRGTELYLLIKQFDHCTAIEATAIRMVHQERFW